MFPRALLDRERGTLKRSKREDFEIEGWNIVERQRLENLRKAQEHAAALEAEQAARAAIPLETRLAQTNAIFLSRIANLPRGPPPMKKGGLIKKTGVYTLHKGEVVVPAHRVKTVDKALKNDNKIPLKK
jgi:hypothetical protein